MEYLFHRHSDLYAGAEKKDNVGLEAEKQPASPFLFPSAETRATSRQVQSQQPECER